MPTTCVLQKETRVSPRCGLFGNTVSGTSEFIHLGHHVVAGDPKQASQACLWGKFQIQGHGLYEQG